ncbi:hypothetical protein Dimus_034801 [Dionaea muscipula]
MCCICVIQKWSRWVATMLPWLVMPLIGLWALSQLLPPAFRFEITSSRLACVFVLLVTLFWYEVLMPQLSAWRLRRNARLRERKRFQALELQKLRKTATRKCRNCLTPYRDQNPGGGKFMCSYCGHISKRPVLDLPITPGLGISNSGIIKDFFGKGGKMLNGKVWPDNGSACPEWLDHGNWVGGSLSRKPSYPRKGVGHFGGSEQCLDEKSYQPAFIFPSKCLMSFLKSLRWLWRKLLRVSSSSEDALVDADHRALLAKRGENGGNFHESRGDKARRKAEEKRQARLEKELLEEEERKQREEVARLVEERRKLRDEKLEAENRARAISSIREKDRKDAERRRQERMKEKDKTSSKSNSDAEELEKKVGKESERKRDAEKKNETDRRESQKAGTDGVKGHISETGQGVKSSSTNASRGNTGTRYFDRMKGTFFSSSRAFTGGSFFTKVSHSPPVSKDIKSSGFVDPFQLPANRREPYSTDRVPPKVVTKGDTPKINPPQVVPDPQPRTAPKSWQQLFTETPAVPAPANICVISRPNAISQKETQSCQLPSQSPSAPTYNNPIDFGFPSPFNMSAFSSSSMNNVSVHPPSKDTLFPHTGDVSHELLPEVPELFEEPCYVPDPVSLIGPVSESLDNFQLDLGTAFIPEEVGKPHRSINGPDALETSRPSPIESPMSRLKIADEKQNNSTQLPGSPKVQGVHPFPVGDVNTTNGMGTWHMWNTSPLCQDGLGFAGAPVSWSLPLEPSKSGKEDVMHPSPQKNMASLFSLDATDGTYSPQKILLGNYQHGGYASSMSGLKDHDLWPQKTFLPPQPAENNFPVQNPVQDTSQKKRVYGSPSRSAANNPFDLSSTNCLTKNEWAVPGFGEGLRNPSVAKSHVGGLYSNRDVQSSLWSFE